MSDGTKIELSQEARNVIARLGATDWLLDAVRRTMDFENQRTVDLTIERRLMGKGPFPPAQHRLGERSRELRNTFRRSAAVVSGSAVESSIGTNVIYAGVHEFGFEGTVTVHPHSRRRFETKTFIGLGKRKVRKKVRKADTFVGAFKRKMNIPARAPITTGVDERIPAVGAAVSAAIVQAWQNTLPT